MTTKDQKVYHPPPGKNTIEASRKRDLANKENAILLEGKVSFMKTTKTDKCSRILSYYVTEEASRYMCPNIVRTTSSKSQIVFDPNYILHGGVC